VDSASGIATIGYGAWAVSRRAGGLVASLSAAEVTHLVDVRLSPCSSDPRPGGRYGAKAWNLQAGGAGIVGTLSEAKIAYEWIVELGNPQRLDPAMTVLRSQLADPEGGWPVHRGLERLAGLVRRPGERVAVLCACADPMRCHRTAIAEALSATHFGGRLAIEHLGPRKALR